MDLGDPADDARLREYARQRMAGQGIASAEDRLRVKTPGVNDRFQQKAGAQAAELASRGLSRSGLQDRAILDTHNDRHDTWQTAQQDSLAEAVRERQAAEREGVGLLRQLEDRAQERKQLEEK